MLLEQILKELKTKYKDLGLGDDYLKVIAKRLARTVKEESEISDAVADLEDEMKFQQSQNDTLRTLKNQIKKFEEGGKNQEEKNKSQEPREEKREEKREPRGCASMGYHFGRAFFFKFFLKNLYNYKNVITFVMLKIKRND